eukprot:jgi/Botrbrau1/2999/Bobra.0026s0057.1
MIQEFGYEIRVRRRGTSSYFPEVLHNGQAYVVAQPGQEFQVEVMRPEGYHDHSIPQHYRPCATLSVDGKSPGYSVLFQRSTGAVFDGFCAEGLMPMSTYRVFKFGSTQASESEDQGLELTGELQISLCIVEPQRPRSVAPFKKSSLRGLPKLPRARHFSRCASAQAVVAGLARGHALSSLKWVQGNICFAMQLPSQCCGDEKESSQNQSQFYDRLVHIQTDWTVVLRYETAATLLSRGILNSSSPAHLAIFAASQPHNPRAQVLPPIMYCQV